MSAAPNRRILLVDDYPAIHADFRKILAAPDGAGELDAMEASLFGGDGGHATRRTRPCDPASRFTLMSYRRLA